MSERGTGLGNSRRKSPHSDRARVAGPTRCVLGNVLGAPRLATATIITSVVALFFGFAAPQSLILGFE